MKKIALALSFIMALGFIGCGTTPAPETKIESSENSMTVKKLESVRKGYGKIVKSALKSSEMDIVVKVTDQSNKYMEKLTEVIEGLESGKLDNQEAVKKLESVRKGYGKIVKASLKFSDVKDTQRVVDTSNKYMEKLTDTIDYMSK